MKLSDLKINPDNPRFIRDERFRNLVKSIEEFPKMMELRPIIIDDNMIILGGNMRFRAIKELKYKEIPNEWVKKASELTDDEKRRFIITDNIQHGDWDYDILGNEWDKEDLLNWGIELPYTSVDIEEDDYHIPDEIETDIKLGDIFQIGQHRLMCGDATSEIDVENLMNGRLSDMIHTDPPYNVDYGANKHHPSWRIREIAGDKQSSNEWETFCKNVFDNFKEFNKGDIYMWGASGPEGMRMRLWLVEMGCHWSATIIWKKDQLILSPAKYQRIYEPCFYGWFGKSTFKADRKQLEVWDIERPKQSKEHPTMKPLKLCAMAINNSSKERDIVADYFLGSGSTMLAAHQLNRICYGMEIDPKYCQVVIDRIKQFDPEIEIKCLNKKGALIEK